jgi:alpha-glucosidase
MEQYAGVIGTPTWQPVWGLGFHLCRWGYTNVNATKEVVAKMRAANIPLEVMWNDIDLYHAFRDFTADPVSFPAEEMRTFIRELVRCVIFEEYWTLMSFLCSAKIISTVSVLPRLQFVGAHNLIVIPIVDAAIGKATNSTDLVSTIMIRCRSS